MARVTAQALRDRARAAMLESGCRGFVRFMDGGALLVTDALRRCADEEQKARMIRAMQGAGFSCLEEAGLLLLTPQDDVLSAIACDARKEINWASRYCALQVLANRWMTKGKKPLTQQGRQIVLEALRLTWQPEDKVLAGCAHLRALAAVMQRNRDESGLYEAGVILQDWCSAQEGTT